MPSEDWTANNKIAGGYLLKCNICLTAESSKVCSGCGLMKLKEDYSADLRNTSSGLQSQCKDCKNRRRREKREKRKENNA